jgi:hypothetical protein
VCNFHKSKIIKIIAKRASSVDPPPDLVLRHVETAGWAGSGVRTASQCVRRVVSGQVLSPLSVRGPCQVLLKWGLAHPGAGAPAVLDDSHTPVLCSSSEEMRDPRALEPAVLLTGSILASQDLQ